MAKRVNFWELPIEDAQPDDTVPAYRGRGQVARVRIADVGGDGTVTSVAVSMPTGFSVANSPVTTSGTITVTFAAGYGLPTTTQMGEWSTAYSWGDHASAGYALASAVTSALAGKVDTSDARLTNSREWTASTVSQAEAEAGTATTRRAWTAQRVKQAFVAAYNALTSVFGRTLASASDAAAARTALGLSTVAQSGSYNDLSNRPTLGTAAAANLTTGNADTTAGRVLKVGDFGIGSVSRGIQLTATDNLNDLRTTGFYSQHMNVATSLENNYPELQAGCLFVYPTAGNSGIGQTYYTFMGEMFIRTLTNAATDNWTTWRKVHHSGNFDPSSKANASHTHSASDITSGTLADARLPSDQAGKNFTSQVSIRGEANRLRFIGPEYSTFFRQDGSALYLMVTAQGDPNGSWTTARPLTLNLATGVLAINGNAATATKWQSARNFTVGNTTRSVDGSANVSWSLAEIGAAPAETTYSKIEVNNLLAGYVTPAAMSSFTYDKATIDSKIDAGGGGGEETYPYRGSLGTRDLNDVRDPGLWGQSVHADATLARNYPFEGVPGALEVLTLNPDTTPYAITTQRYTTNEGGQRIAIRRGGAQGGWSAWREIAIGVGTNAYRDATISTTNPSGGSDGDVWYQIDS